MKQIIAIIVFLSFIGTTNVFGQFSFGGKLGGASTNLTGTGMKDFVPDPKVKFIGGGVINYSFGHSFAIQTEILYLGKGSAFAYYFQDDSKRGLIHIEQKLGYLGLPLMLQFKLGDRSNYFHFDAGLVYNILLHEQFIGTLDAENDKGEVIHEGEAFVLDQKPNDSDLSYAFGIGLVANGLNFDFRYEVGTKKVFDNTGDAPDVLNKSFQVSVGYVIRY